ncbi:MAG: hypothetical protein NWE91_06375 [Candidatus Bathyarchaeota archaeon]|nr:hypothetical protein [Candidatus Bathyarchaeota archaeon]
MKAKFDSLITFLRSSKKTILLIIVVALITIVLSTLLAIWLSKIYDLHVPSIGTIHTLGVKAYWDANLENETKQVYWGTIYPGSSNNVTLHLQSISNINATLHLSTANWTFQESDGKTVKGPTDTSPYMNLTWNYNETIIQQNETIQVTLTLSASSSPDFIHYLINNDVKNFSFDIIINTSKYNS